ncbi:MAG: dihydroorotase [Pseudomonadota bacterium]
MDYLELARADDCHIHLRDGPFLSRTVPDIARFCGRAIVMPNLVPPIKTAADAQAYRDRILAHVPAGVDFDPKMTLYLCDDTTPSEVAEAAKSPHIIGYKWYPRGATTHADWGVSDPNKLHAVFEAMTRHGLVLLVHGEVTDVDVDVFDREAIFIDRYLANIRRQHPELKIVLEHITTEQAVDFVLSQPHHTAATITAHHLWYNRNAMFQGGLQPHHYCLPVLKRKQHQERLQAAVRSGDARFFMGSDSAPHTRNKKEACIGCAGIYTGFALLPYYAEIFERIGALPALADFAHKHGADFYGWPKATGKIVLEKKTWVVPDHLTYGDETLIPFLANQPLTWQLKD